MAISRRLRFEILRRDNHACRYCGACAPDTQLTVDHVVPVALGGGDEPGNLVTACRDCNSGKSASNPDAPVVADVKADALRWSRAMQAAADVRSQQLQDLYEYAYAVERIWDAFTQPDQFGRYERPDDWMRTVEQFYAHGLPLVEWEYAISRAVNNARVVPYKAWAYMCGVMWSRLHEQMEMAEALVEQDGDGA